MVNIEYTGIDGKSTRFGSSSVSDAMKRLRGIRGYNANAMDDVASRLAGAFASKHNMNAERVRSINRNPTRFKGVSAGSIYANGTGGIVAKLNGVSEISSRDGAIVSTSQTKYVSDDGSVVSVGARRDEKIASVPSMSEVNATARNVAESVAKAIVESSANNNNASGTVNVVSGIRFDTSSGPLKIVVETTAIKAETSGSVMSESYSVGEEVMVHESMSTDRHSFVYVISRKSNVSSEEAKVVK